MQISFRILNSYKLEGDIHAAGPETTLWVVWLGCPDLKGMTTVMQE